DRDHVRAGVARQRVAAAVAEGVELLDVADPQARLRLDPVAQTDFEGVVRERIEWAERQAVGFIAVMAVARDQDRPRVRLHGDDRRGQSGLDRGCDAYPPLEGEGIGGLRPPSLSTPMLSIGFGAKRAGVG